MCTSISVHWQAWGKFQNRKINSNSWSGLLLFVFYLSSTFPFRPKLEEEVDRLRVKTANDQTKIQQLTKELKDGKYILHSECVTVWGSNVIGNTCIHL